jgi:murein DD-endopeptidase MepM/ murein hydrolase activator NlpD
MTWRRASGGRRTVACVAVVLAVAVGAGAAPLTVVNAQDPAAVRAAQEIQAARDRANAAAQAMFDAESRLDALEVEIVDAEKALATVEAEANSMRSSLQQDAQRSFVNSGTSMPLLIDLDDANADITADRQASVARGAASVELDDFDAVMKEVRSQRADLERQRDATTQAREQYEDLKAAAEAEVVQLAEIEEQRLADVAVQRELERQRQAKLAQQAAEARQLEANAAAAASSSASATAAPSPAPTAVAPSSDASSGSSNGAQGAAAPAPAPAPAAADPAPAPAPAPVPPSPPPSNAGSGIVCPIAGPRAFSDTWGAGRSGGRSHEGVDMMSPGGTPLVAVESGYAQFKTTRLGGNSVWINGNSGTRYFYAHLSAWEGSSRNVSQGEVIGYVGATGNTTANHLHFEVHPGGGRAVNPYPYVRAVC